MGIQMIEDKAFYKECEGCNSSCDVELYKDSKIYYRICKIEYPVQSPTKQCPCITCLIKGICNDPCADYLEFGGMMWKGKKIKSYTNYVKDVEHMADL